jgi:pimeloyl-ACP methyl ester carboxylesterase
MKNFAGTFLFSLLTVASAAAAEPLVLEKMGIMFVGGREVAMTSSGRFGGGNQIVDQAPVHFLLPPEEKRQGKSPIIMIPGMGLTSYLYLGTPDGREGWAQTFAKAGHPVYVFDEPGNAIAGFEVGKMTSSETPPRIMLWSNETTWRRWGIGPQPGVPAENTRFPYKHIDQLHASMTPVMSGSAGRGGAGRGGAGRGGAAAGRGGFRRGGRFRGQSGQERAEADSTGENPNPPSTPIASGEPGNNPKVNALIELLKKTGPATILVHSAAGPTGYETARKRADLVQGLITVEVTGTPTDPDDIRQHFARKQLIAVYGDNFDLRPMQGRYEASARMVKEIQAAGGKATMIWLPEQNIHGNSHLLMQDTNNDDIAEMILSKLGND